MRAFTRIVLASTLTLTAAVAGAADVGGVKLDDQVTVNGQRLVLNGGAVRKKFFIKVYAAGLYIPSKQSSATAILAADAPRRMVMHFVFNVEKEKIAEAWQEGLRDNTPNASAEVKTAFKTLSSWMEDMKKGQTIVLTYTPGTGTVVEVNGKTKGTLGGKAIADAILNTWVGPKPGPGEDFKHDILGGK
jgi:hypothetical protein